MKIKNKYIHIVTALITIFLLVALQYWFTLHSMRHIRYEELAESIRNVYWFKNRAVYDGVSSNVGWYGSLLVIYELFGFSLHTAKYVRIALHLISLISLYAVLKSKYPFKVTIIGLLTIGLSPTLLYFNSQQTSFGLDLQFAPILLFLFFQIQFQKKIHEFIFHFMIGFFVSLLSLSYPVALLYIPAMMVFYGSIWQKKGEYSLKEIIPFITTLCFGFLLPIAAVFIYLDNAKILFYDPITKSGLFRAGGHFDLNLSHFLKNLTQVGFDLFVKGESYLFELPETEFSSLVAVLPLMCIITYGITELVRDKKEKKGVYIILTLLIISLIPGFSSGMPGIRRGTGVITGLYCLYLFGLNAIFNAEKIKKNFYASFVILILSLLLISHHINAYTQNIKSLEDPGKYSETYWFRAKSTPAESLDFLHKITSDGNKLKCVDEKQNGVPCYYAEIFTALSGYRVWNNLESKPVYAWDWKTDQFVSLNMDHWNNYYFPR